jgi:hypothetical protein
VVLLRIFGGKGEKNSLCSIVIEGMVGRLNRGRGRGRGGREEQCEDGQMWWNQGFPPHGYPPWVKILTAIWFLPPATTVPRAYAGTPSSIPWTISAAG